MAAVMKTLANPYWSAMQAGVEAGATSVGSKIVVQAAPGESDISAQLDVCQALLARGPQTLLVAAITPVNLIPCIKDANAKGVPVIDLDNQLDPAVNKKEGIQIAFAIGSDNYAAGAQAAEYLTTRSKSGKVLVMEGIAGNPAGTARTQGFVDRLKAIAPAFTVVARLPGDWDRLKAANITNDVLQANPALSAVYCANDTMALGSAEALKTSGQKDHVVVIGTDGNSDAVKAIRAGTLDASVAQLPFLVGKEAVEKAAKAGARSDGQQAIKVPTLVLTKAVLDENKDPLLANLR